jgi:OmpA-OmpF porin, OOP family
MIKYLLATFILASQFGNAQEMVRNGSFEQYSGCPSGAYAGALDSALFWRNPALDIAASPDYFNACVIGYLDVPLNFTGYEPAFEGNAYAGVVTCLQQPATNYREYLENELESTLTANKCYRFEMRVSSADNARYVVPELHVYFSDTLVDDLGTSQPLPFTPQLTLYSFPIPNGWTTYYGYYTATGTENYLIIGNFRSASQTNYVIQNPNAQWPYAYSYIDNVSLQGCGPLELEEADISPALSLFPNPASDIVTIAGLQDLPGVQSVVVTTASGAIVPVSCSETGVLDVSVLAGGLYFISVTHTKGTELLKFVKN